MPLIVLAVPFPIHRIGIKSLLTSHFKQVTVLEVTDAEDLLRLITHRKVDLVILDPALPGVELLQCMDKEIAGRSKPPILIYEAGDEIKAADCSVTVKVTGYLAKNASEEALTHAINTALRQHACVGEIAGRMPRTREEEI